MAGHSKRSRVLRLSSFMPTKWKCPSICISVIPSKVWKNHDYLWFAVVDSRTSVLFEEKIGKPLENNHFMKVEKHDTHLSLSPVVLR